MPKYDAKCNACGNIEEYSASWVERTTATPICCSLPMLAMFPAPRLTSDVPEYRSVIDGTRISTRSQHRDHMAKHGVVEAGDTRPEPRKPTQISDNQMQENIAQDIKKALAQQSA